MRDLGAVLALAFGLVFAIWRYNSYDPNRELDPQLFLAIYVPLEVFRIGTCAYIGVVRLLTRRFGIELRSLVIGLAFLIAALLFVFRLMANVGFAATQSAEASNLVLYYRTVARWSIFALMLVASGVPPRKTVSENAAALLTALVVFAAALLGVGISQQAKNLPQLFVQGQRMSRGAIALGYAAMGLASALTLRYAALARRERDRTLFLIAVAMALSIPTEYAFALVDSQNDELKVIGNLLAAMEFLLVLMAIVRQTLVRPWELLTASRRELEKRARELAQANQELEMFAYSASHDLRAPVARITGFCDILAEDHAECLGHEGRQLVDRLAANARNLGAVVDDLLKLARIARQDVARSAIVLSAIVSEIVADLRQEDPDRHVEVVIEAGVQASGDEGLVRVALRNLLDNAWKYTCRASAARIEFGRLHPPKPAVYFVRDNGAGFDVAKAKGLFTVFSRFHREHEYSGMGIGLAIVDTVVRKHGGRIWAESEPGKGATFYFTLGGEDLERERRAS